MANLFAIHKTSANGTFSRTFHITKKRNVKIGDSVYVISSSGDRPPQYRMEGLFLVRGISLWKNDDFRLELKPVREKTPAPSINDQPWYNRVEFRNRFAAGASLVTVPEDFDRRFSDLLVDHDDDRDDRDVFNDAIDDLGTDYPDRTAGITTRFKRDARVIPILIDQNA